MDQSKQLIGMSTSFEALETRLLMDVSGAWTELGYRGASGGGVSYDVTQSVAPDMVMTTEGRPIVVWQSAYQLSGSIYASQYNGLNWIAMGTASLGSGHGAVIAIDKHSDTPYVAWVTGAPGSSGSEIYLKYWSGTQWTELGGSASGGGISNDGVVDDEVSLAIGEDGFPVLAYRSYDQESNDFEIIVKKWTGPTNSTGKWFELTNNNPFPSTVVGGVTYYGGGVSNDIFSSTQPTIAIGPDNAPVVAWSSRATNQDAEIYLRRWNGITWEQVGASATNPGAPAIGGISNDSGESLEPHIIVAPNADGSGSKIIVAWKDYDDWLGRPTTSLYVKTFDPTTQTWVEYTPGSASGNGLLGLRVSQFDLDLAAGVDGLPLIAYATPDRQELTRNRGFIWEAQESGGTVSWDTLPSAWNEINYASQEMRWPKILEMPNGTPVVVYSNVTESQVADPLSITEGSTTGSISGSLYDAYHLPSFDVNSPVRVDSEIMVQQYTRDTDSWGNLGQGSDEYGGIEQTLNDQPDEFHSTPQLATDPSGAVLMAYLQRVSDPLDRSSGHLEPRVVRFNELTRQWEDYGNTKADDNPLTTRLLLGDGGTADPDAPSSWPSVDRVSTAGSSDRSWYGDELLIGSSSGPGDMPFIAYVDVCNTDDTNPNVYGRTTITVYQYATNNNGTPADTSDDYPYWKPLTAGGSGVGAYSYVIAPTTSDPGRGLTTNGFCVDQIQLISYQNQPVMFWREVDPTLSARNLIGMSFDPDNPAVRDYQVDANGNPVYELDANGVPLRDGQGNPIAKPLPSGTSEIKAQTWNGSRWTGIGGGSVNLTGPNGVFNSFERIHGLEGGMNFSPTAVVSVATGKLVLGFSQGTVSYVSASSDPKFNSVQNSPILQSYVALWSYDSVNHWIPVDPYSTSLAVVNPSQPGGRDTDNFPSIAIGLDGGIMPVWERETVTPVMYTGTTQSHLKAIDDPVGTEVAFDTLPRYEVMQHIEQNPSNGLYQEYATGATCEVLAQGYWKITNSVLDVMRLYAGVWQTTGVSPFPSPSAGQMDIVASAFGNGSQFPTVAWERAQLNSSTGGILPFYVRSLYVSDPGHNLYSPPVYARPTDWYLLDQQMSFQLGNMRGIVSPQPGDPRTDMPAPQMYPLSNFDKREYFGNRQETYERVEIYRSPKAGTNLPDLEILGVPSGFDNNVNPNLEHDGNDIRVPIGSYIEQYMDGIVKDGVPYSVPGVDRWVSVNTVTPGSESIMVRRWNADITQWEEMVQSGHGSGTGSGIIVDINGTRWAAGTMPSMIIHSIGNGTQLQSQPVVAWNDIYEENIYAKEWVHQGMYPHLEVYENQGAPNDNAFDFGDMYLPTNTSEQKVMFTLANTGQLELRINQIVSDNDAECYVTDLNDNPITQLAVAANDRVGLYLHVKTARMGSFTHYLQIQSSDPTNPYQMLSISGLRYNHSQITVRESEAIPQDLIMPYGMIQSGQTITRTFTIDNDGTDPLSVTGAAVSGISPMFTAWTWAAGQTTGFTGYMPIYGTGGAGQATAQSVQLADDSTLHTLALYLLRVGNPTDNIFVQIEQDIAGHPSGTPITDGVSASLAAADIDQNNPWTNVTFPGAPRLLAGERYWLVVYRDGVHSTTNYVKWGYANAGAYAAGQAAVFDYGAWNTALHTSQDMMMRLGMVLEPAAIQIQTQDADTFDLNYTNNAMSIQGTGGANESAAQGIRFDTDTSLTSLSLYLARVGDTPDNGIGLTPTDKLYLQIEGDAGNHPSGTAILHGTSDKLDATDIDPNGTGDFSWNGFTFAGAPRLVAGQQYWAVLYRDGVRDTAAYINWGYANGNLYAGGQAAQSSNNAWSTLPHAAQDMMIRTSVSSITVPAVQTDDFAGGGRQIYGSGGANQSAAQGIKYEFDTSLSALKLYMNSAGTLTDNIYVQIEADNAGHPSGTPILAGKGRSANIDASKIGAAYQWTDVSFPDDPQLLGGQQYWLVVYRSGVRDTTNYINWGYAPLGSYVGGQAAVMGGNVWATAPYAAQDMMMTLDRGSLTVNVDFTSDATNQNGVTAAMTIRHEDYQDADPSALGVDRRDNPITVVFTANKPDFLAINGVPNMPVGPVTNPAISLTNVTWTDAAGIDRNLLNYPDFSGGPQLVPSSVAGALNSHTDGRYIVWEQSSAVWLFDSTTGVSTTLGAGRSPNIDNGAVVWAAFVDPDGSGPAPTTWCIQWVDLNDPAVSLPLTSGMIHSVPKGSSNLWDFYPDIERSAGTDMPNGTTTGTVTIAWRSTPARGGNADPAAATETAQTDKAIWAEKVDWTRNNTTGAMTYNQPASFAVAIGKTPGARIPTIDSGRIVWAEDAGPLHQIRYYDTVLLQGDKILEQIEPVSNVLSMNRGLLVWSSKKLDLDWDLYGYYFAPRAGESAIRPDRAGNIFQLTYDDFDANSNPIDQINPVVYDSLIAYEQGYTENVNGQDVAHYQIKLAHLQGAPDLVSQDAADATRGTTIVSDASGNTTIDIGNIYRGFPKSITLTLHNDGTDNATIASLVASDPRITVTMPDGSPVSNLLVPVTQSRDVVITFRSLPTDALGVLPPITIAINSDDWNDNSRLVQFDGTIIPPHAPVLSAIAPLAGPSEDPAQSFPITFATLSAAATASDADNDFISFRIQAVTNGTLTITPAGTATPQAVVPGVTIFTTGDTLNWTPALNANGALAAFSVVAWDGYQPSVATLPVIINVTPVNDAPTLTTVANLTGISGQNVTITYATLAAKANEADVDGDPLQFRVMAVNIGTLTKNGQPVTPGFTLLGPGESLVYRYYAPVSSLVNAFTVEAWDGQLNSAPPVQVRVDMTYIAYPPVLTTISTLNGAVEDTPFTIPYAALLGASNATDANLDPISFRIQSLTSGTLTINGAAVVPGVTLLSAGQSLVWTPAPNANGALGAFRVLAWDGGLASSTPVQVTVNVAAVNDAPTISTITPFVGIGNQDITFTYAQLAAAADEADVDGDPISFRVESIGAGTLTFTKNGAAVVPGTATALIGPGESVVWHSKVGQSGLTTAFTLRAWDGQVASAGSVQVRIDLNNYPTMTAMKHAIAGGVEDQDLNISYNVLRDATNAADIDGDAISFLITSISSGTLTLNGQPVVAGQTTMSLGQTLVWHPAANANGTLNAFTIVASDGVLQSTPAMQVQVVVAAREDIPVFGTASILNGATEDQPFTIPFASMVAAVNASDADGDTLSFQVKSVVSGRLTRNGVVVVPGVTRLSAGDTIVWTPAANANGNIDAFTLAAYDGTAYSATFARVTIHVQPVNDRPVAVSPGMMSVDENTPLLITLPVTDVETPLGSLAFNIPATTTGGGTLVRQAAGQYLYTPAPYFNGADSFTYSVTDTGDPTGVNPLTSETVPVSIKVGQNYSFYAGKPYTFVDADGDQVSITLSQGVGEIRFRNGSANDMSSLALFNTTPTSKLTIAVKSRVRGHVAGTTVHDITVNGDMSTITAKAVRLTGGLTVTGHLGTATFLQATGDQGTITLGGATGAATTLKFGSVANKSVVSTSPLSLTATEWVDDNATPDLITAPMLTKFTISGRGTSSGNAFQAGLNLTNPGIDINTATIAGSVSNADWTLAGRANKLTVGGASGWNITAGSIGTLGITGSFIDGSLTLTNPVPFAGSKATDLSKMTVGGVMQNVNIRSAGNIGTVTTGAMLASRLYAGVKDGQMTLPASGDFNALPLDVMPSIASVTIRGTAATSFSDSQIAAMHLGKIVLKNVLTDTPGTDNLFGLSAGSISSYVRQAGRTTVYKSSSNVWPTDNHDDFQIVKVL